MDDKLQREAVEKERMNHSNINQGDMISARIYQESPVENLEETNYRTNQGGMISERIYQEKPVTPIQQTNCNTMPIQDNIIQEEVIGSSQIRQPNIENKDPRYSSYNSSYNNMYSNDYYHNQQLENKMPKKKKQNKFLKFSLVTVLVCLFVGGFSAVSYLSVKSLGSYMDKKEFEQVSKEVEVFPEVKEELLQTTNEITTVVTDVTQVVENVMPSVVSIFSEISGQMDIFGNEVQGGVSGGSGIIVGENEDELLIVTNNHVIAGDVELTVQFIDGEEVAAVVKGKNVEMDIAVIAIPLKNLLESTKDSIIIAELGDSDSLKVGEPAIAIGNALGYGQSVTTGVISALDRELTVEDVTNTLIQTDAAINPGNSGGALLNIEGEVIGINSNKIGGSAIEGMGYAIPISAAIPIIEDLMVKPTDKGFLGVRIVNVTPEISEAYGLPVGIHVQSVDQGTGAEQAGIKAGDIITGIDGKAVISGEELTEYLSNFGLGETVELTVMRSSDSGFVEGEIVVTLGEKVEE